MKARMQPHEYVGSFRVASNVFLHEAEGESVDDERIEGWMTRPGLRFTPIFDALYPLLMPMLIDLVGSAWPPPAAGLCRLEVSPASVRKVHRVLSMVLAYAIKDGRLRLPVNPAAGVSLPRVRHAEKRYFEPPTGCRACRGVPRTVPAPGALLGLHWRSLWPSGQPSESAVSTSCVAGPWWPNR